MSVYHRYFRVTEGPLIARIDQIFTERDSAAKDWDLLCKEIGADSAHAGAFFSGFKFKKPGPDNPKDWKQSGSLWLPKKSTKAGKELQQRIDLMVVPKRIQDALEVVNLHGGPSLVDGNRWYGSTLCGKGDPGVWFLSVPWRDEDPEKLEKYQIDRRAGTHMDSCLDHLLWTPPLEFTEIKRWQFEKEYEELTGKAA